ncbi:MAG: 50S ribosomal protein L10 [Sphingobacteriia bacterium]|jgi:large subunit ribosomal protein L10|nr:50S ribosomal protein L10 [Sphingobacteriia bacterium]
MTKDEKLVYVKELTEKFRDYPSFYIADTGGLTVAEVNQLRSLCFQADIEMRVIKNTLIKKALEQVGGSYEGIYPALKQTSAVFFIKETPNKTAKLIKDYRKKTKDRPVLKGAYVESSIYLGDASLDVLVALKSREELIGEIIGLLQSPAKNVISALQGGGNKLAGILKTLSEKNN